MEAFFFLIYVQFLSGLTRAMVLFLVASGLSLVFGTLSILNFAHGSFYMLGAFITYSLFLRLNAWGFGFWLSVLLASLSIAFIGFLLETFLIRKTYHRGHIPQLLLTYAFTLIASDIVRMRWGGQFYTLPPPPGLSKAISLIGLDFPTYNLFIIFAGLAVYGLLWWLIYRTRIGNIIRASVFDREVVNFLGVPIPWLFSFLFSLGLFLAALAGGLYAPLTTIDIGMDVSMLIEAFAVVIIGGVGNLFGTLVGSLIVGLIQSFGIILFPQHAMALIFFVMAVVLIVRPYGLMGTKS